MQNKETEEVVVDLTEALRNLGSYRLINPLEPLGRGGMGLVYKAWHSETEETRVVKIMHFNKEISENKKNDFSARFMQEANLAIKYRHPNLVEAFEHGTTSKDWPFMCTEFVEGITLRTWIGERGPLSTGLAANFAIKILDALAFLHQKGIVHRDMSPDNVMIGESKNNRVKVLDLGIAKYFDGRQNGIITEPDEFIGKWKYASPEHIAHKQVDGRSDLYSVGIILYEMLTAQHPIQAKGIRDVSRGDYPEPNFTVLDGLIKNIVAQAMERNPDERFSDADEMIRELRKIESANTFSVLGTTVEEPMWDAVHQSSLGRISEALPLEGRTRLVYTCRGRINDPTFECPNFFPTLTAACHIPVEEFETVGGLFDLYGEELFGNREDWVASAIRCSCRTPNIDTYFGNDRLLETLDLSILRDNIIIIGENQVADLFIHVLGMALPWRYETAKIRDLPPESLESRSIVRPLFWPHKTRLIPDKSKRDLGDQDLYWGIVTYAPNPFNLDKKLLMITGCRRPGQYQLLNWLRDPSSHSVFLEIRRFLAVEESTMRTVQILVKGTSEESVELSKEPGHICRNWATETVDDFTEREPRPFFFWSLGSRKGSSSQQQAKSRDFGSMAYLSLIIDIPHEEHWVQEMRESVLSNSLAAAIEPIWSSTVGFHVTVHEFLHTLGSDDQGPLRSLIRDGFGFKSSLEESLSEIPKIRLVARQAVITLNTIQVLVDLYSETVLATDSIRGCCDATTRKLQKCKKIEKTVSDFNEKPTPFPLHITVASLHGRSEEMRVAANAWAEKNSGKIWGELLSCNFVLTAAFEEPYDDIEAVELGQGRCPKIFNGQRGRKSMKAISRGSESV